MSFITMAKYDVPETPSTGHIRIFLNSSTGKLGFIDDSGSIVYLSDSSGTSLSFSDLLGKISEPMFDTELSENLNDKMRFFVASRNPDTDDDDSDTSGIGREFMIGDFWFNETGQTSWMCLENMTNNAQWARASLTYADLSGVALSNNFNDLNNIQPFNQAINSQAFEISMNSNQQLDLDESNVFIITLTGDAQLLSPLNMRSGTKFTLIIKQDNTGSRALTFSSEWIWPGGSAPTFSTGAEEVDIVDVVCDSSNLYCTLRGSNYS